MNDVKKEYADALFSLAVESGCEKQFSEVMGNISGVFTEFPEYVEFLMSPSVSADERCELIEKAFGDTLPEYILSFLQLLCKNRRIDQFESFREEYDRLLRESEKSSIAQVTSAVPLTDAQKKKLSDKLETVTGRSVTLVCNVDRSIIGGITVKFDDTLLDGSLKRRLHDVKSVMASDVPEQSGSRIEGSNS